jgi:hypothetical protein
MVKNLSENVNAVTSPKPPVAAGADPRIDGVEKDVKQLKTDIENFMALKNTVEDLKNTIVDIRSLMSETQSPFNLLQFITNEEDLNKVVQAKPLIEKKFQTKREETKPETATSATALPAGTPTTSEETKTGFAVENTAMSATALPAGTPTTSEETKTGFAVEDTTCMKETVLSAEPEKSTPPALSENLACPSSLIKASGNILEGIGSLSDGTSIVDWVYTMLDLGFDEEGIRKICDFCEFSNFMPKGYSEHVSNLVGVAVKARSMKMLPEEVILSMYGAADAAGKKTSSKDLTALIMRVLKKNKAGGS